MNLQNLENNEKRIKTQSINACNKSGNDSRRDRDILPLARNLVTMQGGREEEREIERERFKAQWVLWRL